MGRLSALDYAFLALETAESPKHVAGLFVVDVPDNAGPRFLSELFETFRSSAPIPPFDQKLGSSFGLPTWTDDPAIDIDYHVRRHVLPDSGSRAQLVELVSELHEERLDRSRPMWQFHLIEGLKGGERFACYLKIHHAYMDGAKMSARVARVLSSSPDDLSVTPFWSTNVSRRSKGGSKKSAFNRLKGATRKLGQSAAMVPELVTLNVGHALQVLRLRKGELPAPFSAPKTLVNRPLTPPRALAAADLPLSAVKQVAKASGVKVNDVLLEICDSALRRYFIDRGEPVDQPLIAQVPIALERAQAHQVGNQITIALIELATTEPDPLVRLNQISSNSAQVKKKFSEVSGSTAETYTILWNTVAEGLNMAGLTGRARPLGNLVISNLPGPKERLYLRGAPVRALYPISTMAPGSSLNITIYTYAGQMHFGMIAGREAIPDLERLAKYIEEGLEELKTLAGVTDAHAPDQVTSRV
jgi:diacylglycerol O-acyltransferase